MQNPNPELEAIIKAAVNAAGPVVAYTNYQRVTVSNAETILEFYQLTPSIEDPMKPQATLVSRVILRNENTYILLDAIVETMRSTLGDPPVG